jgi:hypothetical protein
MTLAPARVGVMNPYKSAWPTIVAAMMTGCVLRAQSADAPIVDMSSAGLKKTETELIGKARKLIEEKKLLSRDEVKQQLVNPMPQAVSLAPVRDKALSEEEVCDIGRKANLRVGYCYLCQHCDRWHLNLAGGYAIAEDVVATCDHVVNSDTGMREGYLIVVDQDRNVYPVTSLIARSVSMDAAILKVGDAKFAPLPLNADVRQGSRAFCYSNPMGQHGYFSDGVVNRFYWNQRYTGGDKDSLDSSRHLRVNFSTDWAPGSSGSAVLDQAGNAIGHVSEIFGMSPDRDTSAYLTLHIGIPAQGVRMLAEAAANPEEITRLSTMEAKERHPKKPASRIKAEAKKEEE